MKTMLSMEDLESQVALELPEREAPVILVLGCLAVCVGQIRINVEDVNVAAQVCAQVEAITVLSQQVLTCDIRQR